MEEPAGESEFQFLAGKVSAASRAGGTGKGGRRCSGTVRHWSFTLPVSQLFVRFSIHSLSRCPFTPPPPRPPCTSHPLPPSLSHLVTRNLSQSPGPLLLASRDVSCIQRALFLFYQWSRGRGVHINSLTHPGIISRCLREQDSPWKVTQFPSPVMGKK